MNAREQRRAWVLTKVLKGERTMSEAAEALALSERQLWRLRTAFERDGPAGLVHGNRGKVSPRRLHEEIRERVLELVNERYRDVNDCHLAELLAEREGVELSRQTLQRILRAAGVSAKRKHRRPRHRSWRERLAAEGVLLQIDGSPHRWLEDRAPAFSLLAAIDDATGRLVGAAFREHEDTAGYLQILRQVVLRHGIPHAVYHDHHGIFEAPDERAEDGRDVPLPSQFGRALVELGIQSLAANSPQAKGRIERFFGTAQDRLVVELRLESVTDLETANRYLATFVERFNACFAVPPRDAQPAWLPVPTGIDLERVFVLKYRRKVAKDHTIRLDGQLLQLPRTRYAYSGRTVEVHQRLDGSLVAFDGTHELAVTPGPIEPRRLRALNALRVPPSSEPAAAAFPWFPPPEHPWRRPGRGVKLAQQRLTDSPSS